MKNEIENYINLFLTQGNPVYFSIIFIILFFLLIFLTFKYIILPLQKKHKIEKQELEGENTKMLEVFTEYDPNPIIRIDEKGKIKYANKAAVELFHLILEKNVSIQNISPEIDFNFKAGIDNNSSLQKDITFQKRHYSVVFYGIKYLNRAQIYFLDSTEKAVNENKLHESENKFRSLSYYLQDYLENERQRIGTELHDVIGQNLFILKMKIDEVFKGHNGSNDKHNSIVNILDTSINELRNIMYDLKPRNLEDFGLDYAVSKLSEHISQSTGKCGSVECIGMKKRLDIKTELHLFRVIQECLSNIIRHSKASEYKIQFLYSEDMLKIYISDNGIGFEIEKVTRNNYGILNISERIKALDGKMKINSGSEGTLFLFEIPT